MDGGRYCPTTRIRFSKSSESRYLFIVFSSTLSLPPYLAGSFSPFLLYLSMERLASFIHIAVWHTYRIPPGANSNCAASS